MEVVRLVMAVSASFRKLLLHPSLGNEGLTEFNFFLLVIGLVAWTNVFLL